MNAILSFGLFIAVRLRLDEVVSVGLEFLEKTVFVNDLGLDKPTPVEYLTGIIRVWFWCGLGTNSSCW